MSAASHIGTLLKECAKHTKQLEQILAHTTTTGLIQATSTRNCIIRAFANSPTPMQAILVYYHSLHANTFLCDHYTFPALLKACTHLPSLSKGKEVHAHVTKLGLVHDVYVQNSLIHMYGATLEIGDARKMFDEMSHRDVTTWNSLLRAYILSHGLQDEACIFFREMMGSSVEVDEITLLILLSACKQGGFNHGKLIHAYVVKNGLGCNTKLQNLFLDVYAKVGDMDAASQFFAEMGSKDIPSHTILVNAYIASGSLDHARLIFDRLPARDLVLWNSMIKGYVQAKQPWEVLGLFKQMEVEMVDPDEITMVSVLSACASLVDLEFGRWVHRFIRRQGIKEDVFVGTALVDMYAKCGSLEEAILTFLKMMRRDVFAWTAIISGFSTYGHGRVALKLFSQMQREGVKPNEATFVPILMACSHSGVINEAWLWFSRMVKDFEIQPRTEHLCCMVDILSRAGFLYVADEMARNSPVQDRVIAYKTLLGACINYGDAILGERVAELLIKLETQSNEIYVLLSNFYASVGRWDKVEEMRRTARSLAVRKEQGISFVTAKPQYVSTKYE